MSERSELKQKRRWVVKVGSALLTNDGQGLHADTIVNLAAQIAYLREQGVQVVLVSSGSVAAGVSQLGWRDRPERMDELQAAAAVGQASLVQHYKDAFKPLGVQIAQVLLTHADISNRARYLNARSTLSRLLDLNVLSIVNENDTVATDEIAFGDNDNLGALVANMVEADLMVILTDQNGLYTADPRSDANAQLLSQVDAQDTSLTAMASGGSGVGRGGMLTKLSAAQTASRSGACSIIANGREANILPRLYQGEDLGTLLVASQRLTSRKQWMAGQMKISGTLSIDQGASDMLRKSGKSLLAVGVTSVQGEFNRGELVNCVDPQSREVARGLVNYNHHQAAQIAGKASEQITAILGYASHPELIHRDNMVLI